VKKNPYLESLSSQRCSGSRDSSRSTYSWPNSESKNSGNNRCFSVGVATVNVNHDECPSTWGGGTSPVMYTGNILSSDKPCVVVKWFRMSKRCVYVYERCPGLTNVSRCVCQVHFEGGGYHRYFTVSSTSHVRKMISFKLMVPVYVYQVITISSMWWRSSATQDCYIGTVGPYALWATSTDRLTTSTLVSEIRTLKTSYVFDTPRTWHSAVITTSIISVCCWFDGLVYRTIRVPTCCHLSLTLRLYWCFQLVCLVCVPSWTSPRDVRHS
jgi:hypothetical protein